MATVFDVATYILRKEGAMTSMKLQKLCFYSQGWHLAFDGEPLFGSKIEAWANGPVVKDLYREHRGVFRLAPGDIPGNELNLSESEEATIDVVLDTYRHLSATELSVLTHSEAPWQDARSDLGDGERGDAEITQADMQEFFEQKLRRRGSRNG